MSIRTIIENIKSKGLLQAMGLLDQLYQKAIENEEKLAASEAKCAALAAELSQAKSVVSECREYFIAGIMNRIRPTNEGYLHMRCDTLGDETPSHDAFLAEIRAQGVEMVIAYHHERSDALAEVDRNGSFRHHSAAIDATDVLMKIRQGAAQ